MRPCKLRRAVLVHAICLAASLTVAPARADEQALLAELRTIFQLTAKPQPNALSLADAPYQRAIKLAPTDPRPAYAMALVAWQNHRHPDVATWLDEALSRDPGSLAARRGRISAAITLKDYPAALANMEKMVAALNQPRTTAPDANPEEMAAFLGRIRGFLSGPIQGAVAPDALNAFDEFIKNQMTATHFQAYSQARAEFDQQFAQLTKDIAAARVEAKQQAEQDKQAEEKRLNQEEEELAKSRISLESQVKAAQDFYDKEETEIQSKLQPLARELDRLVAQAVPLRNRLLDAERAIDRVLAQAARARDPEERARFRREADRIRSSTQDERFRLDRLEGQINQVRAEGSRLEQRMLTLKSQYQAAMSKAKAESGKLDKTEKRLEVLAKEVAEPAKDTNAKVSSLSAKLKVLASYDTFPLESEKERLLKAR